MKITIVTPAAPKSLSGNRNTAVRWARFLEEAGHDVAVEETWSGEEADLMVALHARRSYPSIAAYAEAHPDLPLVVALTGTDLYRDLPTDENARESLDLATRLIVLQEASLDKMEERHREKTRVIYQSAEPTAPQSPDENFFDVCVIGNLREVKDPFRAALAARLLPAQSRIRILHAGKAQDERFEGEARAHMDTSPRYRWLGELPHSGVRYLLSRSRLLVQSSVMEGGANSVCEALAAGVPVIGSDIPGNVGMLGRDYPGYYPVRDTEALALLLEKVGRDEGFYRSLQEACESRRHRVSPGRERGELAALVTEITAESKNRAADI
ncbi:MAG: selenoneine biosynthesis selenosugar synthase SenB [Rubrobacteraceae bacterium]